MTGTGGRNQLHLFYYLTGRKVGRMFESVDEDGLTLDRKEKVLKAIRKTIKNFEK